MQRINELDWLRGLMALSILVYHSVLFTSVPWVVDSSTVLGRLGIYGVSAFFVLSGLSMAYVYHAMAGWQASGRFYLRRAFRIWPLLAVTVAVHAVIALRHGTPLSLPTIVLNATGLFGFVSPARYISVGAWSIGNELVYYALTPLLFAAYRAGRRWGNAVVAASVAVGLVFAFRLLDPAKTLAEQWPVYVNPFNNLFLYAAGVAIYFNTRDWIVTPLWRPVLFWVPLVLFALVPVTGNQIVIVTGWGRVVFALLTIMVVLGFYKGAPRLPRVADLSLEKLGMVSYGVYLLHPFVIRFLPGLPGAPAPTGLAFVLSVAALSIAAALVIYYLIERPFVQLGKRVTARRRPAVLASGA